MANPFDYILGPTGGLAYHLTALRNRRTRWRPFLEQVDRWLSDEWAPQSKGIVIFGPSAGWTLSDRFFHRFDDIVLVEPDPVARFALGQRLKTLRAARTPPRHPNVTFEKRDDLLPWSEREPQTFEAFLDLYASHAVLFSNVLGQLALTDFAHTKPSEPERRESEQRFRETLAGREWASYHDLFSAERAPALTTQLESFLADDLARLAYPDGGELTDHEMLWLSEGRPTRLASWHLRPGRHHLIGFVHSRNRRT